VKRLRVNHHRLASRRAEEAAWMPLFAALREAVDWSLQVALSLAAPYPEEAAAVEKVRSYVKAKLAGRTADLHIDDALLTLGILIAAIERPVPKVVRVPIHRDGWVGEGVETGRA
jgi:hypothetical protein